MRGSRPCRETAQQLLQVEARVGIGLRDFLLKIFFFDSWIVLYLPEARQQPNGLNDFLLM